MKLLSRSEEVILLTILKLQGNAYGVTIRKQLHEDTGTEWSFGSIYMPLNKLTKKGFVKKLMGDPTSERGGRSKCLYDVTREGKDALKSIREVSSNVWEGLPKTALD